MSVDPIADTETVKLALPDEEFARPAKPAPAQRFALSPVDLYMPDDYISFCLLFPLSTTSEKGRFYSSLKAALSPTLSEIPSIGGYLTPEDGAAGGKVPIKVDNDYGIKFFYRDSTDPESRPHFEYSYPELKQDHFPCSVFDPRLIATVPSCVAKPDKAVMTAQANFIHGGLVLSVSAHHRAADVTTVGTVLKVWAKHTTMTDMAKCNDSDVAIDDLTPRLMDTTPMRKGLVGAQLKVFPGCKVRESKSDTPSQARDRRHSPTSSGPTTSV